MDDPTSACPPLPMSDPLRLLAGTPRQILARISTGDPLGVRPQVERRLQAQFRVLDPAAVTRRALALVARRAGQWSGRPALDRWVGLLVDEAIEEVGRELAGGSAEPVDCAVTDKLGLDGAAATAVLRTLDARSEVERRIFYRLVVAGEDLEVLARDEAVNLSEVGRRARVVLDAVLAAASDPS